jgi:small subunit ribosomal protein S1
MNTNLQNDHNDTQVVESTTSEATVEPTAENVELTTETPEVSDTSINPTTETIIEPEFSMEMIEQSMSNISAGQIANGVVVSVDDKEVLVDIGCKSEATISIGEFAPDEIPAKGDVIRVFVVTRESGDGKPILSKRRADQSANYVRMIEAYKNQEIVTGKITRRVKGGMIAVVLGVEAFLPGSQVGLKNVPNLDQLINKEVQLRIVKMDEDRKNIIVSRRKVLETELESKKEQLMENIKIDAELEGEVKNITDFGAFVDLGGVDGLLFKKDMSWGRINHPSEMLNIGDKIKVKVIGFDEKNNHVSLGIKQLVPHPWENIGQKYTEGSKVTGKVVNLAKYGAFVELEPGVEGLIHITEMSWTKRVSNPRQIVKEGDTVSAIVLLVSKEKQRISLGMKQMQANPWLTLEERYPIGMIVKRRVKNLTTFGIFVEIETDIDGLVHISDISWTKRIYHPKDMFKRGDEIEAIILAVDKLTHRISLGIRQLQSDPWEAIMEALTVNTEVVGRVSKCIPKGLLVDINFENNLIEGFIPISHLALNQIDRTEDAYDIGEEIPMKIIEIDTENRRLILSIKAWFFSRDKSAMRDYQVEKQNKINQSKAKKQSVGKKAIAEMVENTEIELPANYDKYDEPMVEETIVDESVVESPVVNETIVVDDTVAISETPVEEVVEDSEE